MKWNWICCFYFGLISSQSQSDFVGIFAVMFKCQVSAWISGAIFLFLSSLLKLRPLEAQHLTEKSHPNVLET